MVWQSVVNGSVLATLACEGNVRARRGEIQRNAVHEVNTMTENMKEQYDLVAAAVNGLHRKAAWSEHAQLPHALAQTNNYHIPHKHSKRSRIAAEIVCH